ncbi:methionine ABC transporter permease [Vagococcus sp.]|uniref:methionine ABC transporter permease n=1 Tax=Vagococcus sp. TaxID=1933889 RepID=UPI000EEDD313|nr:methionine ABC transporter permease [Vagococcus sp.]HCT95768.1 methionine ABC transporter permease [Vagococcus sp.]
MEAKLAAWLPNVVTLKNDFIQSTLETLYMVGVTALIAGILGIILGVLLLVTAPQGILAKPVVYHLLDKGVNICRSIPFVIMIAIIAPVTKWIVGTRIGTTASIVPLVIGTVPFFSRQIQNALLEVDDGLVEAAESMGMSPVEIIFTVYLKEGLPAIIRSSALTIINLIGLTAMAGAIGGGGLGNLAIARGYNRFQNDVTWVATLILLILVFISQIVGNYFIKKTTHE